MTRRRGTTMRIARAPESEGRARPWGVFWNVYRDGFAGRPKQKSTWFATEGEAEEFRRLTLAALAEPEAPIATVIEPVDTSNTLRAFSRLWLEHVEGQREAATHRSYAMLTRLHILPALGDVLVTDRAFTSLVIGQFYKTLHKAGMALGTRRHVHACLSSMAGYAQFAGLLGRNPCLGLGKFLRQKGELQREPRPNPFTAAEMDLIFDQLAAVEPDWVPYFTFLHDTGVRVGEIAAVRWTAVDLDARTARIEASWSPSAQADKDPKTHERRSIDLTTTVVTQLLAWRPEQKREALRRGLKPPAYVFTTRRGTPRRQDGNMRRVFDRVMAACGLTGHTPHDLRDTFATRHLTEDWNRKLGWVSKQLGHKTPLTTAKHYYAYQPTAATAGFADEIRGRL